MSLLPGQSLEAHREWCREFLALPTVDDLGAAGVG